MSTEHAPSAGQVDRIVRHRVWLYASINQRGPNCAWLPHMMSVELPFMPRVGETVAIAGKDQGHLSDMEVTAITYWTDGEVVIEVAGEDWDEQDEAEWHLDEVLSYWQELGFEQRAPR